jgi:hypothetical protein
VRRTGAALSGASLTLRHAIAVINQRQAGHEEIDADEQTERPSHAARPARDAYGAAGAAALGSMAW